MEGVAQSKATGPLHVLVIGGAGYIGSACARTLLDEGHVVTVFDLAESQRDKVDARAQFVAGDILDTASLDMAFGAARFDAVVHLAALKAVGESEAEPARYFTNNVTGTINILTAMQKHAVPAIVFSSTAAVYAPSDAAAFSETSPVGPVSVYGRTKLIAEDVIREFLRTGAIKKAVMLRYFNVAGDVGLKFQEKNPQNVFPILCESIRGGTPFKIFGTNYDTRDGTCVRDYIHLEDLAHAHALAVAYDGSGTFNLGTSKGSTVRELVAVFERISGHALAVIEEPRRPGDAPTVLADASAAKKDLGWEPCRTLEDMVDSALNAYATR